MRRNTFFLALGICLSLCFTTCCKRKTEATLNLSSKQTDSIDFAFPTQIKHAKGFGVINHKDYKEIYVIHPMSKDTMATYITALHSTILPDSIKAKGIYIPVPAQNVACLSTTEVGSVEILGLQDKLIGAGSPEYIWDKKIQQRIAEGKITEIGRGMGFNIEKIVALAPDLLMQNFMDKTDVDGNLSNLGIKVIYNNSWKEETLLGRAEWLKLMAIFFAKEQMADSIFNAVEQNYNEIKKTAASAKSTPSVMYGYDFKGVWYLPQDDTYVAQTIRDANALFKGAGSGNSSVPKSFEEVYDMFYDAEYWLTTRSQIKNMKEFLSSNERFTEFQATKNNKVYANNKREKPIGGNDYWESGINRPDLLLKDIVKILHPELYPEYETVYWQHLE